MTDVPFSEREGWIWFNGELVPSWYEQLLEASHGQDGCPEPQEGAAGLAAYVEELARKAGVPIYRRVATVGAGPVFIEGLARLVREALAGDRDLRSQDGGRLCPARWGRCPNPDT